MCSFQRCVDSLACIPVDFNGPHDKFATHLKTESVLKKDPRTYQSPHKLIKNITIILGGISPWQRNNHNCNEFHHHESLHQSTPLHSLTPCLREYKTYTAQNTLYIQSTYRFHFRISRNSIRYLYRLTVPENMWLTFMEIECRMYPR